MTGARKSGKNSRAKGAGKKAAAGTRPARSGKRVAATAGQAHQQGKDRWRELVETSSAWIWETDAAIRHTYTNAFVTRCLGYLPAEFLGLDTLKLVHPDDHGLLKELVHNAAARREGWSDQILRWRHKDGSWKYIESNGSALFDEQGTFTGLCGIDRDITEQKRATEALLRSEGKYRDLFENAMDAICIMDRNQNYLDVNRRAVELFGYSRQEFLSMNVRDMLPPAQLARSEKEFAKLAESGAYEKFTGKVRKKDGSYIDVEVSSSAIVEQGRVVGSRDIIRDVTERRKTEELLRDSESRTRSIVESLPMGMHMYRLEADGRLVFTGANPAADKILGVDNSVFIGKTIEEAFPGLKDTEVPQRYRDVASSGKAWQTESIEYQDNAIKGAFEVHAFQTQPNSMVAAFEDITQRKQAESRVYESEKKYRTLFDSAADGIFILDLKGNFIDVNRAAHTRLGYTKEEMLALHISKLDPPEYAARVPERLALIRERGMAIFESAHLRKDGSAMPVEVNSRLLDFEGKQVYFSVIRDITERKQAEEALRKSEKMLQTIFDAEPECVKLLDENANLIMMNRAGLDMLDVESLDQVKGQCVCPLVTADSRQEFMDLVKRVFQGESGVLQFEMVGMKGRRLWMDTHAVPLRNEKDEIVALLGVTRDVTEQKRAEGALRENQARLDLALQAAHMGVWRLEVIENKRYFDGLTCQLLGIAGATFTGTAEEFFRVVHPADRDRVRNALSRTLEHDAPYEPEYRVVWPDGTIRSIAARGRLVRDDRGRPVRINGVLWDITEKRLLEEERLKTQKLESIGTLAGGIAHDFNNLLQGIFGYISMAKLTIDRREKSLAMLEQAEKALHQSVNLTSQLLTFSKGGKPVKKATDLRTVIENSVKFALSGSPVSYDLSFGDDLRAVDGDEGQIGQVVQNIVLNAEQAMPLGGRIEIAARNVPPSQAAGLPINAPDGLVEIVIRDQGTGIPPEHLPRIFDPYFTTKEKGSGLGLATSYSIVKNHEGMIDVSSVLGKGSTFNVYLPASDRKAAADPGPASSSSARACRILLMDDEEMVRKVAYELLTGLGHGVDLAVHGEEAVEKYRQAMAAGSPFDIVILDLTIRGGMGGAETMQMLRAADPGVKAIVSSGYSDDTVVANYREHGFAAFLKKPYDLMSLQATLSELLA